MRALVLSTTLSVSLAANISAQCADGTPRPCKSAVPAARRTVALDDRTWIVVPFKNVAKNPEIDWLRDGSVDLLYRDLSRWTGVHVVDDKRVADFLRDVPAARAGTPLSLSDGLGVARRAGAGRLVMGELLRLGKLTRVTATVYDVRASKSVGSYEHETPIPDSLMSIYGRLARDILNVPPPAGATPGVVGTSSVDAYQEYVAGSRALNRFDATEARKHFERALQLDSAFALAHYKLAIVSVYDEAARAERMKQGSGFSALGPSSVVDPGRARHAAAAARMSKDLPDREKRLIAGLLAQVNGDYAGACGAYGSILAADSSDVEALYGVGQCLYTDEIIEPVPTDTTQMRFRGNWNTSLRLLRRTLEIDPTYHLAFDPILGILTKSSRSGCRPSGASQSCRPDMAKFRAAVAAGGDPQEALKALRVIRYSAPVQRRGDSLLLVPGPALSAAAQAAAQTDAERTRARIANLEQARVVAIEWVEAGPREVRARRTLGSVLLRLGRLVEADSQLTAAANLGAIGDFSLATSRIEVALRQAQGRNAARLIDSLARSFTSGDGGAEVASMRPLVGQLRAFDSTMIVVMTSIAENQRANTELMRPAGQPPPARPTELSDSAIRVLVRPITNDVRALLGVASDSAAVGELRPMVLSVAQQDSMCGGPCPGMSPFGATLYYGLRLKRSSWPTLPAFATNIHILPALALSRGDTAALRAAAKRLDSAAATATSDDGSASIAADAFMLLGDSAAAYAAIGKATALMKTTPMETGAYGSIVPVYMLWPRVMLLRADLAAARGDRQEAQKWYRAFTELWAQADPEFQPIVARARASYLAVGGK